MNPLEYWKINVAKYLFLSKLAKKFLHVSATSVPSERVFSITEIILNKRRNRFDNNTK
ncbi:hypothetical protein ALC57_14231 [Trachymyrmex cornetzi]|uniref:HAT C-terminal dimerisation domain-containing protein n=1 Tax=Trachymyrmex cornetzi TaxID=471704 RepID=A0A195DL02_9HYME|nr:hypothetical protein ALC57_14231 [Trachymyrmex cornetzi]